MCISLHPAFFAFRVVHHKLHLGLDDAQNEMVRLQLVESARAEQDQLEGKAKESEKIIYIRTDPAGNIKADKAKSEEQVAMNENLNGAMSALPGPDEPAFYVKIKEGMYFVSVTEQNMEKILGAKMGFRSDTLCFLDNWNRMYSVGRGYGTSTMEGQEDAEIFVMIGKYGSPEEVDEHFFTDPCPYLV